MARRSTLIPVILAATLVLGTVAYELGTNDASAQGDCPDHNVSGLTISLPQHDGCELQLQDPANGYAHLCNTWDQTTCPTLTNGNEYQVVKFENDWADSSSSTFTARAIATTTTAAAASGDCLDAVIDGSTIALSTANGCASQLLDPAAGYSSLCNTWDQTNCPTLIGGKEYKVDKYRTQPWAAAGSQTFVAQAGPQAQTGGGCPDPVVDGLTITLPQADGCELQLQDPGNGYSHLCNTWDQTSCPTLTAGREYQVVKFENDWADNSSSTFIAAGGTGAPATTAPISNSGTTTSTGCVDLNTNRTFTSSPRTGLYGFPCEWDGVRDTDVYGWFEGNWQGSGTASRSADGREFSIKWKNTNAFNAGHTEFDISVARSAYVARDFGYGDVKVNSIGVGDGVLTSKGRFVTPLAPNGKFHTQAILWLTSDGDEYNRKDSNGNCLERTSVDITVANVADTHVRNAYETTAANGSPAGTILNKNTLSLGDVTLSGVTYKAFSRPIGDVCEKESYYLLRDTDLAYDSGSRYAEVDIRETIEQLALITGPSVDTANKFLDAAYLRDWYVFMAGWELAGGNNSQSTDGGEVEFKYDCVSFPTFQASQSRTATLGNECG